MPPVLDRMSVLQDILNGTHALSNTCPRVLLVARWDPHQPLASAAAPGWMAREEARAAGSRKTVEGTLGGALATVAAWAALFWAAGRWGGAGRAHAPTAATWGALVAATGAASLLEAATTQLDNVFVPLQLFALLCLL